MLTFNRISFGKCVSNICTFQQPRLRKCVQIEDLIGMDYVEATSEKEERKKRIVCLIYD